MSQIIGILIGSALEGIEDLTRAAVAASLRRVADEVERGDIVSDEAFDNVKTTTARIREALKNAQ